MYVVDITGMYNKVWPMYWWCVSACKGPIHNFQSLKIQSFHDGNFCRPWWHHHMLPNRQSTVPPMATKLASWQIPFFSGTGHKITTYVCVWYVFGYFNISKSMMKTLLNEIFSALLALCEGDPPYTDEFPSQRPVTRSFDVLFDLRLNKRLSKQ